MLSISTPLVLLVLRATIILVAAIAVARLLARAAAGTRHLVWLLSLGALLLVPALGAWAPIRLAVLPAERSMAAAEQRFAAAPAPLVREAAMVSASTENAPSRPAIDAAPAAIGASAPSPLAIALFIWAAAALAIAGSMLWAWLAVRRIVRRGQTLETRDWLDPLYEICDRLDVAEPPRLVRSEDAKMPFACGLLRATVVVPAECDGWTEERRRAVLLHEAAHVRRHDLAWHLLARLVCAVYWFHPLVWTAARKLRAESESACDDLALVCGARAADYAEHLLDIVTSVRHDRTPHLAIAMARRSEFEGRMLAILDPERPRGASTSRRAAFLTATLGVLAILVSAAAPVPRESEAREVAPRVPAFAVHDTAASLSASQPAAGARAIAPTQLVVGGAALPQLSTRTQESRRAIADGVRDGARDGLTALVLRTGSALLGGSVADTGSPDDRAALLARVLRTDTSARIRRVAAWGLGNLDDDPPAATSALAEAVRRDADPAVREMSAWALGSGRGSSAAIEALGAAVRSDADERVRATSAWALGSLGDRGAAEALTAALSDRSDRVRMRAVWALGSVEPRQAPPALIALLGDRDPKIRQVTAWALFTIEDPAAAPALQKALQTETDKSVRIAYIRALAAMGEKSVDAVRGLLESSDPDIRMTAIRALAGGQGGGPWPWPWPEPRPFAGQ